MTRARRRRLAVALAGAGLLASGCTSATDTVGTSPGDAVTVRADGLVGIDLRRVDGVHRGRLVSQDEIEALNRRGLAMFSIANSELACQGVMLYLDTEKQADAYGRGYLERTRQRAARQASGAVSTDDPCGAVADAPGFRPDDASALAPNRLSSR